jgi:hypothetical protein
MNNNQIEITSILEEIKQFQQSYKTILIVIC